MVSLAVLALGLRNASRLRQAAWRGWLFAWAWLACTFWWLFVSLHTYGGLPAWMAVIAVLALAGALALLYAGAAALAVAWAPRAVGGQALLFAATWTLAEGVRGRWLTGFPWGAGGYAQVDLMGAWAPWIGVYGMGALAALLAYVLAALVHRMVLIPLGAWSPARPVSRMGRLSSGMVGLLCVGLMASLAMPDRLRYLALSGTHSSGTLKVWLLQGNIAQDEKFEAGTGVVQALGWYPQQIQAALQASPADAPQLVVAPETAVPMLPQQLSAAEFWAPLLGGLAKQPVSDQAPGVSALMGLPLGDYEQGYTNSAWGITAESARRGVQALGSERDGTRLQTDASGAGPGFYQYSKHHLVPFGEFIPPLFRWFTRMMNIPLGDFARGDLVQRPWELAGQRVSTNICYEDLFGEELAASFADPLSAPTVLVNLSNIGWFGDTVAIDQHLQISRLRAMELGRPMLRATNTGATAAIDHRGVVTHSLPRLTRDRLAATVEGRTGLTPYAAWASQWGQWPVWGLCLVLLGGAWIAKRRPRLKPSQGPL
jgi:apolipoprotein N-acyltransferase